MIACSAVPPRSDQALCAGRTGGVEQGACDALPLPPSSSSPIAEGKVVKNRLHLDVRVGTGLVDEERLAALEAECARLVALGAVRVRLLPADGDNESCLVMQDIEGNEFCLD